MSWSHVVHALCLIYAAAHAYALDWWNVGVFVAITLAHRGALNEIRRVR